MNEFYEFTNAPATKWAESKGHLTLSDASRVALCGQEHRHPSRFLKRISLSYMRGQLVSHMCRKCVRIARSQHGYDAYVARRVAEAEREEAHRRAAAVKALARERNERALAIADERYTDLLVRASHLLGMGVSEFVRRQIETEEARAARAHNQEG